MSLMDLLSDRQSPELASQIKEIRSSTRRSSTAVRQCAGPLIDLEQLEWLASRFPHRARFLAEIALDPPAYYRRPAGPPVLDEDFLILSTIHSAKGLDWDAVYVIHAADGNIPSDMATGRWRRSRRSGGFSTWPSPGRRTGCTCAIPRYLRRASRVQRQSRLRPAHPFPVRYPSSARSVAVPGF